MKKERGFTILELMVVVALTGILLTIGVPNFQTLMANNRITSQLNLFSSSLALARSEAVRSNQRVVVCPSDDGATCTDTPLWEIGWITFIDRNADFDVDDDGSGNPLDDPCAATAGDDVADDCILNYVDQLANANMTLRSDTSGNYFSYNGLGQGLEVAHFRICDSRGADYAKAVLVSVTGRSSVSTKLVDGSAIPCP